LRIERGISGLCRREPILLLKEREIVPPADDGVEART